MESDGDGQAGGPEPDADEIVDAIGVRYSQVAVAVPPPVPRASAVLAVGEVLFGIQSMHCA